MSDVTIVRPLESQYVTEMPADVTFECELSQPGMNLIWSKDGRDLPLSTRCVYSVVGEGEHAYCVHRLTLVKVGPGDQGVYAARLPNGLKTEAGLSIECPPRINFDASRDIELIAGKSTIVEVPYTGAPVPNVNWSYNGGSLPIGKTIDRPMSSIDTVYGLTCLRLRHVTREAVGTYKLLVSFCSVFCLLTL